MKEDEVADVTPSEKIEEKDKKVTPTKVEETKEV